MIFAGWRLDRRRRELTDPAGAAVDLSGAEHDLLVTFLENAQRVVGRERLLELSRTRLADSSDRSIDVLVSRLRRKLGQDDLIRTVRGVGYMFAADVEGAVTTRRPERRRTAFPMVEGCRTARPEPRS